MLEALKIQFERAVKEYAEWRAVPKAGSEGQGIPSPNASIELFRDTVRSATQSQSTLDGP
jgi:hypothetical protein